MLYKNIACDSSEFFRAAVNGCWKESKEKVVRLPEIEPHVFEVYVGWLNTGEVDVLSTLRDDGTTEVVHYEDVPQDEASDLDRALIKAFALGDMLQDATFRDSVIDEFITCTEATCMVPEPASVGILCEVVNTGSTMMRLCVDYIGVDLKEKIFNEDVDKYPAMFLLEIAKASVRDRHLNMAERLPRLRNRCFYHEHKDGKGKTKCCTK